MPWRALMAAALVSVLVGAALAWRLDGERSPTAAGALAGRSASALAGRSGVSARAPSVLPPAALGPVSAALGTSDPAYRVSSSGGGLAAKNPAQGLELRFDRSGVQLSSRGLQLGLSLRSAGYGTSLRAVGGATPRVSANRVVYARTGLEEWYANGPLGLEQGFTLPRAPSASASGTLTLAMTLSGDVRASVDRAGQSIALRGAGAASLRYGALIVTDARGHALHSWLALDGRTVLLRVDTHGARYPLRIDPLIQQFPKLAGGPGSEGALFGFSVSLSADGNTAVIGGRESRGTAWVFTRSGSTWEQQGPPLTIEEEDPSERCDAEPGECGFGRSVAVSADGRTALIGAPDDNGGRGAVFLFAPNEGGEWTQRGKKLEVEHEEEIGDGAFGRSVALSADGETALIGANAARADQGAAWVFVRSGSTWTQQSMKLTDGEEHAGIAYFGRSVALSADGSTALVGAPNENGSRGAAWVFTRSGTTWEQPGVKLTGGEQEIGEGRFGSSVALSAFGNTALVGARSDSGGVGAAWVFTRSGTTWEQPGTELKGGEESGEGEFGSSVALSTDGEVALVGGPRDGTHVGAAWLFTRAGTTWEQQGAKLAGVEEGEKDWFGAAVALSSEGGTALVGGPFDEAKSGAAWAFANTVVPPPTVSAISPDFGSSAGGTPVRIVGSGFVSGATVKIGGAAASAVDVLSETELTAVTAAHAVGVVSVVVKDANGESTGTTTYEYVPPPTVASISPAFGSDQGGTPVRIVGSGFREGPNETEVEIGGVAASAVEVVPDTGGKELTAVTPAHAVGVVSVVVKDANGESTGTTTYEYVLPPTVSSITPEFGSSAGGTPVTIRGSGFVEGAGATTVEIGGSVASEVDVISTEELTAVTFEHAVGPAEVVVSDANGESTGGPTYTYVPPPTVASVSPDFGSSAGGTPVTIRGSGFVEGAGATTVEIGGSVASEVDVISTEELTAVTSEHAVGPAEVVVSDANGESTGGPTYTYVPPPAVSSISPESGSDEGGTPVTIRGSGFVKGVGATTVEIGGSAASEVDVISTEELTAVTPEHEAGAAKVVVSDANGVSTGGPTYTYELPPIVLIVSLGGGGGGGGGNPNANSGVLSDQVVVAPPVFGVSGNLAPVSGKILVKLPGSKKFVLLTGITQVPFGTIVNATHGRVTLTTVGPHGKLQTITFYEGEFQITQGHHGVVLARLVGGDFVTCPTVRERAHMARTSSKHASGKHVVRKLWAEGHGSYSTKGSYASGAVLGTRWLTEDLCDGTVIFVATDSVEVTNLVTHRKFLVKAGHKYFAKAP